MNMRHWYIFLMMSPYLQITLLPTIVNCNHYYCIGDPVVYYRRFQNNILTQWPRIACVYCGKLLYSEKASWTFYDPSITYPLQQHIPNVSLFFNPNVNRIPE